VQIEPRVRLVARELRESLERAAAGTETGNPVRWGVIGAAFVLGISAAAGAIGQSRAIAASVEGIAATRAVPVRSAWR
jgi:hypothetical protein